VGTNTVNINKCQVKHILILKKTQDPGAKSLEKLQVQKNLTTLTGLQRKTTESLNETKISRKKSTSPKSHPKYPNRNVSNPTPPNSE
jgi:hypothetical protein